MIDEMRRQLIDYFEELLEDLKDVQGYCRTCGKDQHSLSVRFIKEKRNEQIYLCLDCKTYFIRPLKVKKAIGLVVDDKDANEVLMDMIRQVEE